MNENKNISNKLNEENDDFIKVKREKSKKLEPQIIQNALEIQPLRTIDLSKSEFRNVMSPNKGGFKKSINHNYTKLKSKSKGKEIKEIKSPLNDSYKQRNFQAILLPKKTLGRSLPKTSNYNKNLESQNYSINNIKRITSSNNIEIISNNNEKFSKTSNSNPKYKSNGFKYSKKNTYNKEMRENKFENKIKYCKKNNQKEILIDTFNTNNFNENNINIKNYHNLGNKKINHQISYNNMIRPSNSFNNSSFQNKINNCNNEGKNFDPKNNFLISNNLQNILINNMNANNSKRSMSSSTNITRNKLKQRNDQFLLNGLVIYPQNELMKSTNINDNFNGILEHNDNKNKIIKKMEQEKYFKKNQYLILKGNASYLIKNCMAHRINWVPVEKPPENYNSFNFKWKELSIGIDYNSLNRIPGVKQIVNHYENHFAISNKANMFINLMKYCEQRKISVFKYVPFTIVFKIKDKRKMKNKEKQIRWSEKLEKLKVFIQNIDKNVKNYYEIGKFYFNEEYIKDKEKRNEFEKLQLIKKRRKEKELEESKEKEKNKKEKANKEKEKVIKVENNDEDGEERYDGKFKVYSDIFPRLKLTDKLNLANKFKTGEVKESDKKIEKIGNNTLIEIPTTHFKGKNMWVLKAVNLNRGMCIKVVNSFEQMEKVINKFKNGVDYRFTVEEIEEKQNPLNEQALSEDETSTSKKPNSIQINENDDKDKNNNKEINKTDENMQNKNNNVNNINKKIKEEDKEEKIYNCTKIVIQKYIENPLLYKGRKCDMRIWVLLTHQMKVFLFKEGHLKTCSVEYDLNSKNAFTHITNYSFQKYNTNFQKFEKGNEVPFYEFQNFIDKEYPEKNFKLKKDLIKKVKEIISLTMRSGKDKINKNGRSHQFEIFGYDFMLDSDFNVFLIEINTNPGLEISSPWIQIVVPRMLDDALRLTVDKVFDPVYDFEKSYKGNYTEEQKKLLFDSQIKLDFNAVDQNLTKESTLLNSPKNKNTFQSKISNNSNENDNLKINLDSDDAVKKLIKVNNKENKIKKEIKEIKDSKENNKTKEIKENKDVNKNKSIKNIKDKKEIKGNKDNKSLKSISKSKEKKLNKDKGRRESIKQIQNENINKYISPFPVPGYSLDENLWEFVCDLNSKDPFELKNEKEINIERESISTKKHSLQKKDKKNNSIKGILKKGNKGNKGKKNKNKNKNKKNGLKNNKSDNKDNIIKSPKNIDNK